MWRKASEGGFSCEVLRGTGEMKEMEQVEQKKRIYLASPHMSEAGYEQMYIKEAFDTNWVSSLGKNVDQLESELADMVGTSEAAALSAGTAAIHLALKALEIGPGDVVFCSTLTFSATANPIRYAGATPVFIDSDYRTWNMSPEALRKAFAKYPDVKAVIVVHLYGMCADMDEIMGICREHGVPVVEDAAESLGTTYHGKWTGTLGDYGIYSFNGNKIITTSGGGMLVCNIADKEAAAERIEKVRFWSTQAREKARHYQHEEIGYNYRMSNITAGIGRGQLRVLNDRVEKKRYIYAYYKEAFKDIEAITFMPMLEDTYSNCWLTCIQIDPAKTDATPDDVMDALAEENIESRPVWKPMHLQPVFKEFDFVTAVEEPLEIVDVEKGADNSVGGTVFLRGVCLPSDTKMTDEELDRVCGIVRGLFGK